MDISVLRQPQFKSPGFKDWLKNVLNISRELDCVQIEVTSHCSGKCIYCPHTISPWQFGHMTPETMASLWPVLCQSKRAHLQGWGEPLLHPCFFDFAEFAVRAGCQISTTSCGLGMTEKKANAIIQSGMDMIAFSLAGTDAKSNNARSGVDFDVVRKAIDLLQEAKFQAGQGPQIHFAYLLLADRMEAALKLPDLLEQWNVDVAIISTLDFIAAEEQKPLAILPDETEKIVIARQILEEIKEKATRKGKLIYYSLPTNNIEAMPGGCREQIATCLYVSAAGDLSPCVYLNVPEQENLIFGNVNKENALQIWQKPGYKQFRQNLCSGNIPEACSQCPKKREIVNSI